MENFIACAVNAVVFGTALVVGLKLGHVIEWSWWLVLCPVPIVFIAAMAGLAISAMIAGVLEDRR